MFEPRLGHAFRGGEFRSLAKARLTADQNDSGLKRKQSSLAALPPLVAVETL